MNLWSLASNSSAWRGYEYYRNGKVTSYDVLEDGVFESHIQGSSGVLYHTIIDTAHPRKSHCNCPFAEGRRVICKHMVALLFTVSPSEAEAYMHEIEESENEENRRHQAHLEELERYVKGLKKEDLQRELFNALVEIEEREYRY
jgi:hypothetical protein